MAREGGFFSPNRKVSGKDKQVASSMSSGSYGGYVDAGESRGFVSPEQAESMLANPERFKMRPSETRYLRESMGLPRAQFFSPSGNEVGQIASATTDLGGLIAQDTSESKYSNEGYNQYLNENYGFGTEDRIYKNMRNYFKQTLQDSYKDDVDSGYFKAKPKEGAFAPQSIGDKIGNFLANTLTFSQPLAAGTLDANQVAEVSERPKLNYVNPDAKTMSLSEIGEAFKPKNLFGYKDKFGRFDDPGSPLAVDRAQTIQRVAQNFSSPIVGDARTIGQIRADQEARMRENARLRNESFQRGERVQQKSADVTYGTNMLSNPAFGFRDRMTDDAKAKYDQSAKDATEMARTDPSLGNVAMQTINRVSGFFGGPQASLESIGERQLRLANKEINRPTYQKEAYARKFLGITNDQLKAKNEQRIRANAYARNQAFQADKRAKAVESAARRYGQNTGSGRTGGFGAGTVGRGMKSNPGSQRQQGVGVSAGNLSRHSVGHSSTQPGSKGSKGSTGSKGSKGSTGSKGSKGSTGGSKSSGSRGQGGGTASRGKGGSFGGSRRGTNTSKSRRRCDIRTKIDITQLNNPNLIKDDLATIAYFVQEIKEK